MRLLLVGAIAAVLLSLSSNARIDPAGSSALLVLVAALLTASRAWWNQQGRERMADACGTVGVVALGGMIGGAIAMLGLTLHFPLADPMLHAWDRALHFDGIAVVQRLVELGQWIFWLMAPAYNFTIPLFFGGLLALARLGDRTEAWRAAFCFVGTLLTTCSIALFVPAKGLGVWLPADLGARLPDLAMRSFWAHFDQFYSGADPALQLQVVDGVISFPSFHTVVGFLVLAMWRTRPRALILASLWLILMLLGTLPGGGHYGVDLIAGFLVWAGWFALSLKIQRDAALPNTL